MQKRAEPDPAGLAIVEKRMAGPADNAALAPLRRPLFRAMWIAVLVSNMGGWMQNVGAAWLMTSLSSSPVLIAMVQAANTLPIFLLALPAGALADVLGSRNLLLADNLLSFISVSVLAALTLTGFVSPVSLLVLTFAVGIGTALGGPAFQSSVNELVPEAEIPSAVSLNSAGFNFARCRSRRGWVDCRASGRRHQFRAECSFVRRGPSRAFRMA